MDVHRIVQIIAAEILQQPEMVDVTLWADVPGSFMVDRTTEHCVTVGVGNYMARHLIPLGPVRDAALADCARLRQTFVDLGYTIGMENQYWFVLDFDFPCETLTGKDDDNGHICRIITSFSDLKKATIGGLFASFLRRKLLANADFPCHFAQNTLISIKNRRCQRLN